MLWLALALAISVSPQQGFEPITAKTRTTVTPDAANRSICVGYSNLYTGEESFSCRTLDGANEPKTFWHTWKGLHAGRYVMLVQVETADGKTHAAQTTLNILSTE